MNPVPSVVVPVASYNVQAEVPPADEAIASASQPPPSAEQVRAAQAVFSQHSDANFAFGLLGVWTSTLLLHDLALETFSAPADEEEERQPEAELA